MKSIVLAKISKRIFSAIIDLLLMLSISLVLFFTAVFPATFDKTTYVNNLNESANLYLASELYLSLNNQLYLKTSLNYPKTVEAFISYEYVSSGTTYKIECMSSLFEFYTENMDEYELRNINVENFKKDVLNIGSEKSNIKSFDIDSDDKITIEMIDATKESTTVSFLNDTYADATENVTSFYKIKEISDANSKIMLYGVLFIIPIFAVISFILYALIPMLSPNGETIGKRIFGIGVLTKDGYTLPKGWYITRWLSLFIIEFVLGIATAGGLFLISYIMFVFDKKRRCIHDKLSNSVVIDKKESIWFYNKTEQDDYYEKNHLGN